MDIQDKIAIVTGASEGIGLETAKLLSKHGAKVILAARSEDKINQLAAELPDSLAISTDMTKPEDITNLIGQTMQKYGRIDILINNAGRGMYAPLETIDVDEYKKIMELNVFSVVRAMRAVIPIMRKQGEGFILNVSSRVSQNYYPFLSAYASTKYALNALSLTARAELEKDNIVVGIFLPKMTATQFGKNAVGASPVRNDSRHTGQVEPNVDTAGQVAEQILEQIKTEEPLRGM